MWLGEKGSNTIVEETWRNGHGKINMEEVMAMISTYGQKLDLWNRTSFVNVQKQLHKAKQRLKQVQDRDPLCVRRDEQNGARDEIQTYYMSCFLLLGTLCLDLESMMTKF